MAISNYDAKQSIIPPSGTPTCLSVCQIKSAISCDTGQLPNISKWAMDGLDMKSIVQHCTSNFIILTTMERSIYCNIVSQSVSIEGITGRNLINRLVEDLYGRHRQAVKDFISRYTVVNKERDVSSSSKVTASNSYDGLSFDESGEISSLTKLLTVLEGSHDFCIAPQIKVGNTDPTQYMKAIVVRLSQLASYYHDIVSSDNNIEMTMYAMLKSRTFIRYLLDGKIDIRRLCILYGHDDQSMDVVETLGRLYHEGIYDVHVGADYNGAIVNLTSADPLPSDLLPGQLLNLDHPRGVVRHPKIIDYYRPHCAKRWINQLKGHQQRVRHRYTELLSTAGRSWSELRGWRRPLDINIERPGFNNLSLEGAKIVIGEVLKQARGLNYCRSTLSVVSKELDIFKYIGDMEMDAYLDSMADDNQYSDRLPTLIWKLATSGVNLRNILVGQSTGKWLVMLQILSQLRVTGDLDERMLNRYESLTWLEQVLLCRTYFDGTVGPNFMTKSRMLNAMRGRLSVLQVTSNVISKYERYSQLPLTTQRLLIRLYQLPLPLIAIVRRHSKMEDLIIEYRDNYGLELAQKIGMFILPSVQNVERYVIDNLVDYKWVVNRDKVRPIDMEDLYTVSPKYLLQFGDLELMNHLNCYVSYSSRYDLLVKIYRLMSDEGFFVPMRRNSLNSETLLWTDINDHSKFMIGYGTLFKYHLFELEELDMNFKVTSQEVESSDSSDNDSSASDSEIEVLTDTMQSLSLRNTLDSVQGGQDTNSSVGTSQILDTMMQFWITNVLNPLDFDLMSSDQVGMIPLSPNFLSSYRQPDHNVIELPQYEVLLNNPRRTDVEFSTAELHGLSELLYEYFMDTISDISSEDRLMMEGLLSKINVGLDYRQSLDEFCGDLRRQLADLMDDDRAIVKEWLHALFETGMYMRRWRGPGHPYPLSTEQTMVELSSSIGEDPIHESLTLQSIGRLGDIEGRMTDQVRTMVRALWTYDLRRGNIIVHRRAIDRYISNVVTNDDQSDVACIRVNSTIFVGTAYAYLRFIFNESIEGFNVNISSIQ